MALLKFKRSAVPAKVPSISDLSLGELAINTYDGKVYTKKDNGTPSIVEIGGNVGTVTSVSGTGTVNGLTLTGTVTSSGSLTLGGTLSGVSLTSQVSGTLPVANGGTGSTSLTSGRLLKGNGTSAVTASVIQDDGTNVGIGIAPSYKLDVNGTTRLGGTTGSILAGVGTAFVAGQGELFTLFTNDMGMGTSGSAALKLYTTSTERMRIDASGNVGIGTTSPQKKLAVSDGGNIGFEVSPNDAAQGYTRLLNYNRATSAYTPVRYEGSTQTWFVSTAGTTRAMDIDSSGNLLVGTTSNPYSTKAVVNGSLSVFGPQLNIQAGTSGVTQFELVNRVGGGFDFYTNNAATLAARITSAGDVGIGTSSPWAKLSLPFNAGLSFGSSTYPFTISRSSVGELVTTLADGYDASTARVDFVMRNGSASQNTALSIAGSGNVGIGTSAPATRLDVQAANNVHLGVRTGELDGTAVQLNAYNNGGAANVPMELKATNFVFNRAGAAAMVLDTNGNVGIGTTSPGSKLQVGGATGSTTTPTAIQLDGTYASSPAWDRLKFYIYKDSTQSYGIGVGIEADLQYWAGGSSDGMHRFYTARAERMRIDTSGNLLVGVTSATMGQTGVVMQPAIGGQVGNIDIGHANGTAEGNPYIRFYYNAASIGSITQNGTTAVLYNTSSDVRLKENIADADDAASLIDAIQVRQFDWKADGSHQRYGFVAQELLEVAPEAVSQPVDPDEMMGVDYSKLVPMLVKELQSVRARLAQLEGK